MNNTTASQLSIDTTMFFIATTSVTAGPEVAPTGPDGLPIIPVFGLPGLDFYYIHVSAVISLSISLIASAWVIVYMLWGCKSFAKLPVGERLVFYLAVCDFGYSLSHDIEHSYFLGARDHPPNAACVSMAYFMLTFYAASGFLVVFTAVNALVMVVFMRKLVLGKHDWILLVCTIGSSACLMAIAAATGFLGPTGAWCEFDVRKEHGRIGAQLISICTLIVFAIDLACYTCVLVKIRRSMRKTSSPSRGAAGSNKYIRSARVMIIFVVVYFIQNWPAMVYYIWAYFTDPPLALVILLVILVNIGGLFNALTYTVIRKRYQTDAKKKAKRDPAGTSSNEDTTVTAQESTISP